MLRSIVHFFFEALFSPGTQITKAILGSEVAEALRNGATVILKDKCIYGDVDLVGTEVQGAFQAYDCHFTGEVALTDAHFHHAVEFHRCKLIKGMRLTHARIDGQLSIRDVIFGLEPENDKHRMDGLHVKKCIEMVRSQFSGGISMKNLYCGGSLRFCESHVNGDLDASFANVQGEVDFGPQNEHVLQHTVVKGSLFFVQSHIGAKFTLSGCRADHVSLELSRIGGTIYCTVWPETVLRTEIGKAKNASLYLFGAHIFGNLEFQGAKLEGMLNLSNSEVRGNIIFRELCGESTSIGASGCDRESIRLVGSSIGGRIEFENAELSGGLNLTNARVGEFEIDRRTRACLEKQIKEAPVGILSPPVVQLTGWTFGNLTFPESPEPLALRDRLLELVLPTCQEVLKKDQYVQFCESMRDLDESVYSKLEQWLRLHGRDEAADLVYLRMRSRELKAFRNLWNWWRFVKHGFLLHLLGYGLRIRWLVTLWVVLFIATGLIFGTAESVERPQTFISSRFDVAQIEWPVRSRLESRWDDNGGMPDSWNVWDAVWVTVRLQVPIIPIFARNDWEPSSRTTTWLGLTFQYDSYATGVMILNWIIVPLIIAGLAGLLKRRAG